MLFSAFVAIPLLIYAMFNEGDWAAGLALTGLLALPAATFALWASGARERVVRVAVFITIAAIPLFLWVETRAFMK